MKVCVDYDDPRWKDVIALLGWCTVVDQPGKLTDDDFPIEYAGKHDIAMDYLQFGVPWTLSDILDVVEDPSSRIRLPNRAETETFFETYPSEPTRRRIISFCGCLHRAVGQATCWYITAVYHERHLGIVKGTTLFPKNNLILVVKL